MFFFTEMRSQALQDFRSVTTNVSSARKFVTITFIFSTIIAFLSTTENKTAPVAWFVYITFSAVLFFVYSKSGSVFKDKTVSLLPLAIAIEFALFIWARNNVQAQVLTTILLSICLFASKLVFVKAKSVQDALEAHGNSRKYVLAATFHIETNAYIFAWVIARLVVIIISASNSSATLWYISQVLLVTAIFISLSLKRQDLTRTVYLTLTLLILSTAFYVSKNVVPYGMLLFLIVLPVAFVIDKTFNAHYIVKENKRQKYGFFKKVLKVSVVILFILIASVWQAYLRKSSEPDAEDSTDLSLLNKRPAFVGCKVYDERDRTCCNDGYMLFPHASARGCVHLGCFSRIANGLTDCCGNILTNDNIQTMGGKYLCVAGSSPTSLYL